MELSNIIQELNRRFAEPLPEFYRRRIIFWYDEDQEFVDQLEEIEVSGAKLVTLTCSNNFSVKKLLNLDDPGSNYLVYCPLSYGHEEDNWLLDIELYSEEFRADLISIWMEEMRIPSTPAMRKQVRAYRKFFNARARRNKVAAQHDTPATPAQLQLAIMAALAGLKEAKPDALIRAVLQAGIQEESNAIYRQFVDYGIHEAFWRMVAQGTGFENDADVSKTESDLVSSAVVSI